MAEYGAGGAAEAGNYKGVMLCNRPTEPTSAAVQLNPSVDAPSFRPVGLPAEPLGLNPAKENLVSNVLAVHDEAARRRASEGRPAGTNFLNKHRAWLHEMGRKKAELNAELQHSALAAEEKRHKFVAYTKSLRDAVRERAAELDEMGIPHAAPTMGEKPKKAAPMPPPPAYEAAPAPPPPPPPKPAARPAAASKPAWARTEVEDEEVEDAEAALLVDFAKDLDYESYIDDLEVRQALNVIRERIDTQKALDAVAADVDEADDKIAAHGGDWRASFISEWNGEDDAGSTASKRAPVPEAPAYMGDTKPDWDASTNAGDGRGPAVSQTAREMAEQMLMENPDLKSKHSVRSLASVFDKSGSKQLKEAELPPLRVVTIVENPKVAEKQIDPSNLPYLHRNPAI